MGAEQESLPGCGVPVDNQVGHRDGMAGTWMVLGLKSLIFHLPAQGGEMFLQHGLLLTHAGGAADSWAKPAKILQVAIGPLAVEVGRLLVGCRPRWHATQ